MTPAPITTLHHLALTVTDLAVSAAWYERVFSLEKLFEESSDDRRAAIYRMTGSPLSLALVEHRTTRSARFDATTIGLDHAAFTVESLELMHEWARYLDECRVAHSGVIDVPPGAILNFKDPDGIALAMFWDRAGG
jgi:catechol-2,3-dioxygenase